jgi:1,4-dihydroxy-2-naphthoate octaprenyltransferase
MLIWLRATRPQFFSVIILPILLGTVVAWHDKQLFSLNYLLWSLLAGITCAAAANVLNDYFDHLNQTDDFNHDPLTPYAGGSRMIQNGTLSPRQTLYYGLILLLITMTVGLYLVWARGLNLLWLGLIGILSVYFYSAPPSLHRIGLGEVTIGLNYGMLAVAGAYFVQTQSYSLTAFWASLPLTGLATAILYINQFPDFEADRAAGKCNWVVRLGWMRAKIYFNYLILLGFIAILVGIMLKILPMLTGITLVTLPLGLTAIKILQHATEKHALIPAIKSTIALHISLSLLLIIAFLNS